VNLDFHSQRETKRKKEKTERNEKTVWLPACYQRFASAFEMKLKFTKLADPPLSWRKDVSQLENCVVTRKYRLPRLSLAVTPLTQAYEYPRAFKNSASERCVVFATLCVVNLIIQFAFILEMLDNNGWKTDLPCLV
jgi:hypothetical protein